MNQPVVFVRGETEHVYKTPLDAPEAGTYCMLVEILYTSICTFQALPI